MKWNNRILATVAALTITACAEDGMAPPANTTPQGKSNIVNTVPSEVTYFDSEVFDLQLSRALRSDHSRVHVKTTTPININAIPVRLNAWLVAVQRRGGNVNLAEVRIGPDGKQQEFVQLLLPIALDVLSKVVAAKMGTPSSDSVTKDVLEYVQKDPLFLGTDNLLVTIRYSQEKKVIRDIVFQKL